MLILDEARHNYSKAVQTAVSTSCPTQRTIRHLEQRARRDVLKQRQQSIIRVDVNNRDLRTITAWGDP